MPNWHLKNCGYNRPRRQKVHAICVKCGSPANHSHRLVASDELVVLGEKDEYEPLCRHCYNAARAEEVRKQA